MGHEAMTTFPTNVTQVNMVTGADESGYYTFVEVVFMKEKKEMNWMLHYFVVLDYN